MFAEKLIFITSWHNLIKYNKKKPTTTTTEKYYYYCVKFYTLNVLWFYDSFFFLFFFFVGILLLFKENVGAIHQNKAKQNEQKINVKLNEI